MPRPLTSAEREQIVAAGRRVESIQEDLDAAVLERDIAILQAFNARAQVTDIAHATGLSRQGVYALLSRLAELDEPEGKPS